MKFSDFLDEFSNKSRTTLYGGLVHTHTNSSNSKLSLPKISDINRLDLCKHLTEEKVRVDCKFSFNF